MMVEGPELQTKTERELLHGFDYQEGRKRVEDYKRVASALKKRSDVSI